MAYFVPSACWALVALAALKASGLEGPKAWYRKPITLMAAAAAGIQIFILIDAGLFTGFGRSPYSFTPLGIAVNALYLSTGLLGVELSRAYLMKSYGLRRPILTLGVVTLLYTLINTPLFRILGLLSPGDALKTVSYLGSDLLPTLTENLLTSYLALLGGPIASLAYRGPLGAFRWFVPILPDLTWGFKALLGVVPPTLGYLYVNQAVTLRDLRLQGEDWPVHVKPYAQPCLLCGDGEGDKQRDGHRIGGLHPHREAPDQDDRGDGRTANSGDL